MKKLIFVICALLAAPAIALPFLQLDAIGDNVWYVGDGNVDTEGDEDTTYVGDSVFTLRALVDSSKSFYNVGDTYYISAAVMPSISPEPSIAPSIGTFDFDGDTINVTGDMEYGTPPLEDVLKQDDLASHGIFETYFYEFSFLLSGSTMGGYDVEQYPGGTFIGTSPDVYVEEFTIDVSALNALNDSEELFNIHFDLYTKNADNSINKVAPFSHDVSTAVPVPGAILLGILGLGIVGAKMRKFA